MRSSHRVFLIFLSLLIISCDRNEDETTQPAPENTIRMRWIPSFTDETEEEAVVALQWCFSFLGAPLNSQNWTKAHRDFGNGTHEFDLSQLGFQKGSLKALQDLNRLLQNSEEYKKTGGIDMGRYVMLTLNSSHHYYAITGAEATLSEFIANSSLDTLECAIIESTVSKSERLIRLPSHADVSNLAFVALEGAGSIEQGSFEVKEYEVLRTMPNGQHRFAIYDVNGKLKTEADRQYSIGGKPAKCVWCHETSYLPNFEESSSLPGYLSVIKFNELIAQLNQALSTYRQTLETVLDFDKQWEHQLMEVLYISFNEPSARRLALEWNMPESEVRDLLGGLKTHRHHEFDFLGDLYYRSEINRFSPYDFIQTPDSAREHSFYEPNLILPQGQ